MKVHAQFHPGPFSLLFLPSDKKVTVSLNLNTSFHIPFSYHPFHLSRLLRTFNSSNHANNGFDSAWLLDYISQFIFCVEYIHDAFHANVMF
jgi:hypothetical protein